MGALTSPEDVAQAMDRIEKEAVRMGGLVEDLLALARLDEAKPLQLAEVDLVPLANDTALDAMASDPDRVVTVVTTEHPDEPLPVTRPLEVIPPTTPSRGVSLATGPIAFAGATLARLVARRSRATGVEPVPESEAPTPALGAIVYAEENKIRQVLANLVGNALRFTPDGSPIEVGVGVDVKRDVATLSVIDHGEGIPPRSAARSSSGSGARTRPAAATPAAAGSGSRSSPAIVEAHDGHRGGAGDAGRRGDLPGHRCRSSTLGRSRRRPPPAPAATARDADATPLPLRHDEIPGRQRGGRRGHRLRPSGRAAASRPR